jgi:hypothetical protein
LTAAPRYPRADLLRFARVLLERGVALHPSVLPALAPWAEQLGVPLPAPLAQQ